VIIPGVDPNSTVYLNGEFLPVGQARVSVLDRGFIFGDGVYEVVPCYRGKPFRMAEHLARLARSLKALRIDSPLDDEGWKDLVLKLAETGPRPDSIIYLQVTRGAAKRDHAFPAGPVQPTVFGMASPYTPPGREQREQGLSVIGIEDERWLRCDIKSLNLLGNVLAKQKAAENGAYEAIQHRGETVTEGSSSNVFIVKDGVLLTHPATNLILNGITRQVVFGICGKEGIPFREEPFTVEDLCTADEVLITSTTSEVMPVVDIDGKPVAGGTPGTVTLKLQHAFDREIHALSAQAVPGAQN